MEKKHISSNILRFEQVIFFFTILRFEQVIFFFTTSPGE